MFDLTVKIDGGAGEGGELGASLSGTSEAQPTKTSLPAPAAPALSGADELACTQELSEPGFAEQSEGAGEEPPPQSAPQKKRHHASPVEKGRNWLMGEPYGWIGRKVRNRANASIYTVRQIFKNGRVQLERNWMSYSTDVQTVRVKYDPHS